MPVRKKSALQAFVEPVPFNWLADEDDEITQQQPYWGLGGEVRYRSGDMVFTSGQHVQDIYIFECGEVLLTRGSRARSYSRCPVEPHEIFGIIEMLAGAAFESGLEVSAPSRFWVIDSREFIQLLQTYPDISLRLAASLGKLCHDAIIHLRDQ